MDSPIHQVQESSEAYSIASQGRQAFLATQLLTDPERSAVLVHLSDLLLLSGNREEILARNAQDLAVAQSKCTTEAERALLRRLSLQPSLQVSPLQAPPPKPPSIVPGPIEDLSRMLRDLAKRDSPIDLITYQTTLSPGLDLWRLTRPLGLLLIIFESRPEVLINLVALALKTGNAIILKPGIDSLQTSSFLLTLISQTLEKYNLPPALVQVVFEREIVGELLRLPKLIDLVIPRGSNALVTHVQNNSSIPLLAHADGICTVYVDQAAGFLKTKRVVIDAKTDYPSVCNAAETLLLHVSLLSRPALNASNDQTFWSALADALCNHHAHPVTLKCDAASLEALSPALANHPLILPAHEKDYETEFLTYTLAVKVVDDIDQAVSHINTHGSHHTDVILTEHAPTSDKFVKMVDSASVFVNASSRFADGFRYGFGTEVYVKPHIPALHIHLTDDLCRGVATGKLHARGPVGLEGLCTYKYIMRSSADQGHVVSEFAGPQAKPYLHKAQSTSTPYLADMTVGRIE